jgi:outer membrane lipoprotein carrier protein
MARQGRIGSGAALALILALLTVPVGTYAAAGAAAAGGTALDRYLDGLNGLSARFTQTVTNSEGTQIEAGAGDLIVQRPGKFRWEYTPNQSEGEHGQQPRGQLLVADGRNLWFYDKELSQVTVKPVAAALSATPIVLLSGSSAQLHESFDISTGQFHDGLDWVDVKPRAAEADFVRAELGFNGGRLMRMIVHDRLGQTVQLDFSSSDRNPRIDTGQLKFVPPAGVDVIGAPQN